MTIFLVGDMENFGYMFADAEMTAAYYGHFVLNPMNFPDIKKIQEALIDCSDAILLLKGWANTSRMVDLFNYATKVAKIPSITYSPKAGKRMKSELTKGVKH